MKENHGLPPKGPGNQASIALHTVSCRLVACYTSMADSTARSVGAVFTCTLPCLFHALVCIIDALSTSTIPVGQSSRPSTASWYCKWLEAVGWAWVSGYFDSRFYVDQMLQSNLLLYTLAGVPVQTPKGGTVARVVLLHLSVDLPARALVLNMKQFNGKYGCSYLILQEKLHLVTTCIVTGHLVAKVQHVLTKWCWKVRRLPLVLELQWV